MPNYNCGPYIAEALDSLLAQSHTSWELIFCDDNSTDNSLDVVREYMARDERIKLITNSSGTRGSAMCRNLAMAQASGEYLAFLDSDDVWYPRKLEKQIAFMRTSNIDICYMAYDVMRDNGEKIHTIIPPEKVDYVDMLKGKWMHTSTVAVRRSLPLEFPLLSIGQDIAMWLRLFRNGNYTGYALLDVEAAYRLRNGSSSSRKFHTIRLHWKRIRQLEQTPLPLAVYYYGCYAFNMLKKYLRILPEALRLR